MSDEKVDLLCEHCGQAFSAFLHEMAEHNAKVTSCPNCGKPNDCKPAKGPKSAASVRGKSGL